MALLLLQQARNRWAKLPSCLYGVKTAEHGRKMGGNRDAAIVELVPHFTERCKQLRQLLHDAKKHMHSVYWAHGGTEHKKAIKSIAEAFDSSTEALAALETQSQSLRRLTESVKDQVCG
jgi:hypothetical protein